MQKTDLPFCSSHDASSRFKIEVLPRRGDPRTSKVVESPFHWPRSNIAAAIGECAFGSVRKQQQQRPKGVSEEEEPIAAAVADDFNAANLTARYSDSGVGDRRIIPGSLQLDFELGKAPIDGGRSNPA